MPITPADFIVEAGHLDLVKLHRSRWATMARHPETGLMRIEMNTKALDRINPAFARFIAEAFRNNNLPLIAFWIAMGEGLANGPKLVRPKAEDCAQLENFLLTIPFDQYAQPFPTVFVEWPQEFRAELQRRYGVPCHRASVFHHDPRSQTVIASHTFGANHPDNLTMTIDGILGNDTIEDYFDFVEEEEERRLLRMRGQEVEARPENDRFNRALEARGLLPEGPDPYVGLTRRLERTGMNLMMCLHYQGWAHIGWSNRRRKQDLRRRARRGDRNAEARIAGEFEFIGLQQEIKIADPGPDDPVEGEALGRRRKSPHPHWRRGHERNCPVGPRGSGTTVKRKIPPVLVRAAFYKGDLATTGATYLPGHVPGE